MFRVKPGSSTSNGGCWRSRSTSSSTLAGMVSGHAGDGRCIRSSPTSSAEYQSDASLLPNGLSMNTLLARSINDLSARMASTKTIMIDRRWISIGVDPIAHRGIWLAAAPLLELAELTLRTRRRSRRAGSERIVAAALWRITAAICRGWIFALRWSQRARSCAGSVGIMPSDMTMAGGARDLYICVHRALARCARHLWDRLMADTVSTSCERLLEAPIILIARSSGRRASNS